LLRWIRAAVLGSVGFALSLVAHVAAGGAAPGSLVLMLMAGLVALAAVLITGARLGPVRVLVALTAMQVVLHEAFMWLGAPAVMATMVMGHQPGFSATAMVGAHVAATALTAALLAYGEAVLWFLAGCVRAPLWLCVSPFELSRLWVVSPGVPPVFGVRFACGGVGRRGPPLRGLFAIV